jgi:hypothetical protein
VGRGLCQLAHVIATILIGLALLGLGVAAWTGTWRRWAAWDGPPAYNIPITVIPGLGLAMIAAGFAYEDIGRPVVDIVGAVGMLGGLGLSFARPRWWGPRWYRRRREHDEVRLDLAISANVLADVVEGEPARRAGWWSRWGRGRVAGWWRARLDDVPGTLVLYRTALAFAPLEGPNELLVIKGDELRQATTDDGHLTLDLVDGASLRLQVRNPSRAAARIARTLRP